MKKYDHKTIESKWQSVWEVNHLNKIDLDASKKPFYNLMMFPYPSAEGLHIGSVYTFSGIDTYGRFMRMRGYDVFEPFGLDGFGIHSENYAIKIKENILTVSARTEKHYYEQIRRTGNMIDWSRKLETYDPSYYKWTQWLFIQLFKAGLAYRKEDDVNWCPSCKTVLSDEQVIDGKCERCGSEVTKRSMSQWFFRITAYAQRLLENLDELNWVDDVKTGQRNWIGRSEGAEIEFDINRTSKVKGEILKVFTTAPETLMGVTFLVVAPEHKIIEKISKDINNLDEVLRYIDKTKSISELDRQIGRKKTGLLIEGVVGIHPITKKLLPIYVADYVLSSYGSGAIMAVPAHDERDYAFAKEFSLPIISVVKGHSEYVEFSELKTHAEKLIMANSQQFNGLNFKDGREKIISELSNIKSGKKETVYKLRDWCVSRQRYWGPPIPMIYCESCKNSNKGYYKEEMPGWWPEENLPVILPEIKNASDTIPDGSGKGALSKFKEFYEVKCPHCQADARRETDVSDSFVDSSWYFLRYPFTEYDEIPFGGNFHNEKSKFNPFLDSEDLSKAVSRMKKWGPVTCYIGGKEHTVLHLLYARFITMAFHDLGYLEFEEPFTKFYGHGLITKDGAKMSKSKGNVINPDEYFDKFGADAVRMYLRFMGPFNQGGDWSDTGMQGMYRFVNKVYKIYQNYFDSSLDGTETIDESCFNKAILKITRDMDSLKFNTTVAEIMKIINWYLENQDKMSREQKRSILEKLLLILAPFLPHMSEELWQQFGHSDSIHLQKWPEVRDDNIQPVLITIAIQVDGKIRGTIEVNPEISEKELLKYARNITSVAKHLKTEIPSRVVYVKRKVINILN